MFSYRKQRITQHIFNYCLFYRTTTSLTALSTRHKTHVIRPRHKQKKAHQNSLIWLNTITSGLVEIRCKNVPAIHIVFACCGFLPHLFPVPTSHVLPSPESHSPGQSRSIFKLTSVGLRGRAQSQSGFQQCSLGDCWAWRSWALLPAVSYKGH